MGLSQENQNKNSSVTEDVSLGSWRLQSQLPNRGGKQKKERKKKLSI